MWQILMRKELKMRDCCLQKMRTYTGGVCCGCWRMRSSWCGRTSAEGRDNQSRWVCEPCESPAERLWIISHLLRPGWLMLTSPLSLDGLRSLEVCGSVEEARLTNHGRGREELRLKGEGPGMKEGGILWNSGKYQRETGACLYCFCPPLSCCPTPIFAPSIRYHFQGQLMTTFPLSGVLLPRQF